MIKDKSDWLLSFKAKSMADLTISFIRCSKKGVPPTAEVLIFALLIIDQYIRIPSESAFSSDAKWFTVFPTMMRIVCRYSESFKSRFV